VKRHLSFFIVIAIAAASIFAQTIAKPTLTPKDLTPEQKQLVEEGIKLHDNKDYDAAIRKYEQVLAANPDAAFAMYELAMSQYTKGDKVKAMETSVKGSKYVSPELPLFYMTIASVIDDVGKPDEAVKIYKDAIKILKDDKGLSKYLANVYFNLGVTYVRQNKYLEGRQTLKEAADHDPRYASPHFLLSELFAGSKYKIPAFLAASRFISLEYNTTRTARAAQTVKSTLQPAPKDEKTGNVQIFLNMDAPKDEGDFTMFDLFLGTMMNIQGEKDKNKPLEEIFADSIDSVIGLAAEDKKLRSTFVGRHYIPFLAEMKQKGYSRSFSYIVLLKTGNQNAAKWLAANNTKTAEFLAWAKAYAPQVK
jgi:tetratricopeptide (TPR) repeat protein